MIEQICQILNLDLLEVLSASRKRDITEPRHVICAYLVTRRYTYTQIGRMLNRDHSTIMHSVAVYKDLLSKEQRFASMMQRLVDANPSGEKEFNLVLTGGSKPYMTYTIEI